jgi:hypothetical protein
MAKYPKVRAFARLSPTGIEIKRCMGTVKISSFIIVKKDIFSKLIVSSIYLTCPSTKRRTKILELPIKYKKVCFK